MAAVSDTIQQEVLANFMAVTGAEHDAAVNTLNATDWVLEEAVNLYLLSNEGGGGGNGGFGIDPLSGGVRGHGLAAPGDDEWPDEDFAEQARGGRATGPGGGRGSMADHGGAGDGGGLGYNAAGSGDNVRAPIAAKVERLYGDYDPRMTAAAAMAAQHFSAGGGGGVGGVHHGPGGFGTAGPMAAVNVFRDFKAEGAAGILAGSSSGAGGASGAALSGMFKPPSALLFKGTFEQAKQAAEKAGMWLLVNTQSGHEFASYQLNRDTWQHEMLQQMLTGSFVFVQYDVSEPAGKHIAQLFQLVELPVIMIIDPVTGAKLWDTVGFVEAEKLLEDLVPFLDNGPNDAGAVHLAQTISLKRKALAGMPAGGTKSRAPISEDDQMAMAIAASMGQDVVHGNSGSAKAGDDLDDLDEAAIYEQIRKADEAAAAATAGAIPVPNPGVKSAQEVQEEASARLPPEPSHDECKVAVRLPDGSRRMRRFERTDLVSALYDFCLVSSEQLAAGRRFALAQAIPGAQPLNHRSMTLGEAGVAGGLLAVKLED